MTMSSSSAPARALAVSKTFVSVVAAVREADDGADLHIGPAQHLPPRDIGRADADRGHVVLGREAEVVLDEGVVELRAQQRVVDRLRELALGHVGDRWVIALT